MNAADGRQCLTFLLDEVEYGVELSRVREVVRYEGATRVPRAARRVRGVVNLHGSVVPVVDLAAGLGLSEAVVTPWTCLIVVETAGGGQTSVLGLLADSVCRVLDLGPEDLEPPPAFGTRVPAAALLGTARTPGGFVHLMDLDRVLDEGAE